MTTQLTTRRPLAVVMGLVFSALFVSSNTNANGQAPLSVTEAKRCLSIAQCEDPRAAAYDLARNQQFNYLINLANSSTPNARDYVVAGISAAKTGRHNKAVMVFMKSISASIPPSERFSDTAWYALQFLADRCDPQALQHLVDGGASDDTGPLMSFEVSSEDWASSLRSFGNCHFYGSREALVRSLGAANIDAGAAAFRSLQKLYPHVCSNKSTTEATMDCFEKYFRKPLLPRSSSATASIEGTDRTK